MRVRNVVALATLSLASVATPVAYIGCNNSKVDELQSLVQKSTGDFYIDSLIAKLNNKNRIVREKAVQELGETRNNLAIKPLITALSDENERVRESVAWALGKFKSKEAVEPLIALLSDDDWLAKKAAANSLGNIGDKRATKPLCFLLLNRKEQDAYLDSHVIIALGKLKDKEATSTLVTYLSRTRDNFKEIITAINSIESGREEAIKTFLNRLNSEDLYYLPNAIEALGKLEAKEAVEPIIKFLSHENDDIQRSSIKALSKIRDEKAVKPLCNIFYNEKPYIQREIIDALGEINSKESVLPLLQFINNDDEYIRGDAAWVLGKIGDKRATQILANRLRFDDSPHVRRRVAEALGKIGDPAALESLNEVKKILDEYQGNKDLKEEIQKAISKIKAQNNNN